MTLRPLANDFVPLYRSPDPQRLFAYSPGIARLGSAGSYPPSTWAGLVAVGPAEKASRHCASMALDGDGLVVLSRSGDERAKTPHDGNLITFHRVTGFRKLVY